MKKIQIAFLFLFVFSNEISFAQKISASDNIQTLKNGALFVRLKTSELKINALKNKGMVKEAEEIRIAQEKTNASIRNAFKNKFNFCPVYFFYSNNSNAIKEGNYRGLIFTADLQTDSVFTGSNYLIGEFDESETTQLNSFIIKNKNYDQLRSPFPYLIKRNQMGVNTQSDEEMIMQLNKKLFEFYKK